MTNQQLQISKRLQFEDVRWPGVLECLVNHGGLPFSAANSALQKFLMRLKTPLDTSWFRDGRLTSAENSIVACACECHGADRITIAVPGEFHIFRLRFEYQQIFEFTPQLRAAVSDQAAAGICVPSIEGAVCGRPLALKTLLQVATFRLLIILAGSLFWALSLAAFLYGLALLLFISYALDGVFSREQFLEQSALALFCFGVGAAALFGRWVRVSRKKWRKKN